MGPIESAKGQINGDTRFGEILHWSFLARASTADALCDSIRVPLAPGCVPYCRLMCRVTGFLFRLQVVRNSDLKVFFAFTFLSIVAGVRTLVGQEVVGFLAGWLVRCRAGHSLLCVKGAIGCFCQSFRAYYCF